MGVFIGVGAPATSEACPTASYAPESFVFSVTTNRVNGGRNLPDAAVDIYYALNDDYKNYALIKTGEATDELVSYFGLNPTSWWEDESFSALEGFAYSDIFVSN